MGRHGVTRRSFLRTTALGSAALALAPQIRSQPARLSRKPNLLIFLPDQQRADTLACYGARHAFAPNLDKLASQSFVFEQAYITQPICTASRSSLFTGTWPHTNGCTHNDIRLDSRFRCWPELIADGDYRTGYMGKWHLGDEQFAQHGFHEWISIMDGWRAAFTSDRDPNAISDYSKFLYEKGLSPRDRSEPYFGRRYASRLPFEFSKPMFLELKTCDFLDRHARDPFVLVVAFLEPHPPYNGPLNNAHPLDQIELDATSAQVSGDDMPLRYRLRQKHDARSFGTTPERYRKVKQRYLGLVTEVDRSIGAILTKLEQLRLADNTIVIHSSDHGDMMGAHRLFGKEVLFQEAVRVPYLVRMPDQARSVSVAQAVSHIDFGPTILDLLGQPPAQEFAGRSRAPLLRGEAMTPETVFLQWAPKPTDPKQPDELLKKPEYFRAVNESSRAAIVPHGLKLCLRDGDKNEFYNLRADPREEHNLFEDRKHRDVIARLAGEIHRWQESVADPLKV
jgi:arylsulfatase A-like enzyme